MAEHKPRHTIVNGGSVEGSVAARPPGRREHNFPGLVLANLTLYQSSPTVDRFGLCHRGADYGGGFNCSGVAAVIQPGGSLRDKEVIEAADRANIAMVFTGRRHFRHI